MDNTRIEATTGELVEALAKSGLTAMQMLNTAQYLYENKIFYPKDSECPTEDKNEERKS